MNKCPCKECITFVMCNTRLKGMIYPEVCVLSKVVDCDELKKYIGVSKSGGKITSCLLIDYEKVDEARNVFGLSPVNKGTKINV